jgi:hypothetical protein
MLDHAGQYDAKFKKLHHVRELHFNRGVKHMLINRKCWEFLKFSNQLYDIFLRFKFFGNHSKVCQMINMNVED